MVRRVKIQSIYSYLYFFRFDVFTVFVYAGGSSMKLPQALNKKEQKREYDKKYCLKNKEQKREYDKKYYLKNKEHRDAYNKEYYLKHREHKLKNNKKPENIKKRQKYYLKNKIKISAYGKEYNLKNKKQLQDKYFKNVEYIKEQHKEYNRRPETRELRRNYSRNKYKTNINFRLAHVCRSRIWKALKFNSKSAGTMKLIGCTIDELRKHIESLFKPWMTWENQGLGGWDLDHIIACANFDLTDPAQQRACFNWSNLQPLEHIENIKKGAR